jgi:hypothetical protein
MLGLTDTQLKIVMNAARLVPVEKRDTFLQRIAAMLALRGRGRFTDTDVAVRAVGVNWLGASASRLCSEYKFWAAGKARSPVPKSARRNQRITAEPTTLSAWACRQPGNKRSTFAYRRHKYTTVSLY